MPKQSWPFAAAGLLLLFWCGPARAATDSRFTVDVLGTAQGLPSSVVLAVAQTRDSYLWVGTLNGLARFDGVQFAVFDENNTPGLNSSQIIRLYEDRQTNLWVGAENGSVAIVKADKVASVNVGQGGRADRLMAICEDASGAVLLYTDGGSLARHRDGKFEVWQTGAGTRSTCRALIAEESGRLWVGTDLSLVALNPIPVVTDEVKSIRLNFLLASKGGGYWRLANGRIQKWKGDRLERDLGAYPWTSTLSIFAACEDQNGNLVVGTYGDGVYWFDADGKATRISKQEGLSHDSVLAVTVDREGCLWVGTNGGGLNRVKRKLFEVLERSRESVVQSVCEDAQGAVWIGYTGNRIDHWSPDGAQQFRLIPSSVVVDVNPDTLLDVKSVFVGRNQGALGGNWILSGTWGALGPHLFQLEYGRFVPLALPPALDTRISAIFQDRAGRLWLGTQGGLLRFDDLKLFTTRDGLSANDVRAIAEDPDGSLWVGTEGGGLNRLRDGQFTCFTKAEGLPGNRISAVEVDREGVLWVATFGGLARFQGGKWTRYSKEEGLASNSLGYLLEDGQGCLWIGSNAGLMRLKKAELNRFAIDTNTLISCRLYGEADGLPATECTAGSQPGALRGADGTLWFPTIRGLASLNPKQLLPNTNPPPVIIQAVLIDGRLQNPDTLRASPPHAVTVPAGKERLEIRYASLNLAAPERGRFKCRLEGYETTWKEQPGSVREARYTKLPPGQYYFQVKACNEDDVWSRQGATLAVTVLPPFWRTWWFLGLTTLCLLGLIVGSVHYVSTQRLQRQLAVLRQKEAVEKDRARIARDIHDQLGASLTQISLLGELVESDKNRPAEVEAHARQIEQAALETTHALDEIVWTVNPSNDTLDGLITYVCKYAQDYLAVAGLHYRLEVPSQLPGTPISPEVRHNVFLASKESITNVVRHAQATAVVIRMQFDDSRFSLEIQDNGRGLAGMDQKAAQARNGLRNMRKRMEDVGGSFSIGPAPEGGTLVRLTAPLGSVRG
ncbi:MAG TPA: two-component regulator propeller domain-containing protein [Candidatus Paceibacterota bacterium]|nr:two-component regulator propeller domain-containing protein [Verrucomicrobiota bacterium]HSA10071.1 two-component regulator propeller domain-containing protein [Candidatus Paceibacterota bacterium]